MKDKIVGTLVLILCAGIIYFAYLQMSDNNNFNLRLMHRVKTQVNVISKWFSSLLGYQPKKPVVHKTKALPNKNADIKLQTPEIPKKTTKSDFFKGSRSNVVY